MSPELNLSAEWIKGVPGRSCSTFTGVGIELACGFWVSLALLVSYLHVRALLGGGAHENPGASGPRWKQEGVGDRRGGWRRLGFRTSGLAFSCSFPR